jgi:hypothetical protein
MSNVDWSLAPKDAQIYSPADDKATACWYKKEGGKVYCWPDGYHSWSTRERMIGELIERPEQPKPWSGPEDGLPPVGTECEWKYADSQTWKATKILYIGSVYAIVPAHDGEQHYYVQRMQFRAIKTPDQIAADKRETAIRELMDIAQVDCRVTAARLVDAGFKREGV